MPSSHLRIELDTPPEPLSEIDFADGKIFDALGGIGITGFNLYSMIVAIIGAIIVLWIYHAIFGRKVT